VNRVMLTSAGLAVVSLECIKGYAFKMEAAWVKCALLPVICANFGLLRDSCAHLYHLDCLSPRYSLA